MNNINDHDYALANNVSLDAVRTYLEGNGWQVVATPREDVDTYVRPSEEDFCGFVLVPKKNDDRTVPAILDVARKLSAFEDRSVLDVLNSLQISGYDHVQCRLISSDSKDGSIPLNVVSNFVKSVVTMFSAALKDVVKSEFVHKALSASQIKELLNVARFGQTECGSFIVNVYIPFGQSTDAELFTNTRSYLFRKSLIHLMTSLSQAISCIDEGIPDMFIQKNLEAEIKTSVNLLEAVDNVRVGEDSELEVSVNWSHELPVPSNVPSRFNIKKEHSQTIWNWVAQYRPKEKQMSTDEFTAKVISMEIEDWDKSSRPEGIVTFLILDNENYEAQATLNAEDFRLANDCFMNNHPCVFRGVCERSRNKAIISSISSFRVFTPENSDN